MGARQPPAAAQWPSVWAGNSREEADRASGRPTQASRETQHGLLRKVWVNTSGGTAAGTVPLGFLGQGWLAELPRKCAKPVLRSAACRGGCRPTSAGQPSRGLRQSPASGRYCRCASTLPTRARPPPRQRSRPPLVLHTPLMPQALPLQLSASCRHCAAAAVQWGRSVGRWDTMQPRGQQAAAACQ